MDRMGLYLEARVTAIQDHRNRICVLHSPKPTEPKKGPVKPAALTTRGCYLPKHLEFVGIFFNMPNVWPDFFAGVLEALEGGSVQEPSTLSRSQVPSLQAISLA